MGGYGKLGWQCRTLTVPRIPDAYSSAAGSGDCGIGAIESQRDPSRICASAKYEYRLPQLKARGLEIRTLHTAHPTIRAGERGIAFSSIDVWPRLRATARAT